MLLMHYQHLHALYFVAEYCFQSPMVVLRTFFLNDRCGWNRKKDNGANFAKLVLFVCAPIGSMTVIGLKMSHVLYTSDAHLQ